MKLSKFKALIYFTSLTFTSMTLLADLPQSKNDWQDHGVVLTGGGPGSWDVRFDGAISPSASIKKNGIYYLYYIGADGNRSTDGGPRHRAMGVATSTDGINFTKFSGNPILTYLPHNNEEEGLFSAAVTLDDNGDFVMYYGVCEAGNSTSQSVACSGRLATSTDGLNFTDKGTVLNSKDSSLWNYGDEVFPIGTFKSGSNWYVYYIAKGFVTTWGLGIAWGPDMMTLSNSAAVQIGSQTVRGGGDVIKTSSTENSFLIERNSSSSRIIEAYTSSATTPGILNYTGFSYSFSDYKHHTLYLDNETNTWFMFYQTTTNSISVKTAPNGGNSTPPSTSTNAPDAPSNLQINIE